MSNPLQKLLSERTPQRLIGIPSLCSANHWVIDAGLLWARQNHVPLLLEVTANQTNQYGGYTGLTPGEMAALIKDRAERSGFPLSRLFLGGDHLGPMVWKNEAAASAMEKADILVRDFVLAGFTKIHLDASMPLADDDISQGMDPALVASRGARLAAGCEQAYAALLSRNSDATPPVYVIGSEVPVAGGAHQQDNTLTVTTPESFRKTVALFKEAFAAQGLAETWKRVIAVVVQPGVEYGNDAIIDYDSQAAASLSQALDDYPGLVFEGHSTDYQRPESLSAMIRDGVAILKVGPALTFALREGFYALEAIEKILFAGMPEKQSRYCETLEQAMLKNPAHWQSYFPSAPDQLSLNFLFGLSDRCRYYLGEPEVKAAEERLLYNLSQVEIPLGLLRQFFPDQFRKVRQNVLSAKPSALLLDKICSVLDDYRCNK